jgi:rhamnogalacturonyl hydrolase YesR
MLIHPSRNQHHAARLLAAAIAISLVPHGAIADKPYSPPLAEGYATAAAGTSKNLADILSIEPLSAPAPNQNRLVLIGGLDHQNASDRSPSGTDAIKELLKWWSGEDAKPLRAAWQVAAIPDALPDASATTLPPFPPQKGFFNDSTSPEARYIWRWTAMSCPDLVIDLRAGTSQKVASNRLAIPLFPGSSEADASELVGALGQDSPSGLAPVPAIRMEGSNNHLQSSVKSILAKAFPISPLRTAFEARVARAPLTIARLLANRYPSAPSMSYIPALSWSGALSLSKITGDPSYREKALKQMAPFLDGSKPSLSEKANLPSIAGHLAFSDLAKLEPAQDAELLARKAAEHLIRSAAPSDLVPSATRWTDDMFMAPAVLARVAAVSDEPRFTEVTQRLLESYSERLQRPDGIFVHVESSPFAWGRGNGFAAFGLMDSLTHLRAESTAKSRLINIFQRHMNSLLQHQSPDGAWRQVIDEPGAYREFTATAMITTAMARGIRSGWLDQARFLPAVNRGWKAVSARIANDATLTDVCTGTGAKKDCDRSHYLHRDAIFGPDDRGGAMGLTVALEIHSLNAELSSNASR